MASDENALRAARSGEALFPPPSLPAVFVDGVMNLSHTTELARFYLSRFDPSLNGIGQPEAREIVQIIMPISGFSAMTIFFSHMLEKLVANGIVKQADLERIRDLITKEQSSNAGT